MATPSQSLLAEIEAFISRTGMGESYFGKRAVGNSELIPRLRKNGRVWPETAEKARSFIRNYAGRKVSDVALRAPDQGVGAQ